jgi:hypothetical protein
MNHGNDGRDTPAECPLDDNVTHSTFLVLVNVMSRVRYVSALVDAVFLDGPTANFMQAAASAQPIFLWG